MDVLEAPPRLMPWQRLHAALMPDRNTRPHWWAIAEATGRVVLNAVRHARSSGGMPAPRDLAGAL